MKKKLQNYKLLHQRRLSVFTNVYSYLRLDSRVARWHVFKLKFLIWLKNGGTCNIRFWFILWPFCLFYGNMLCPFGIFCGYLVHFFPFWHVVPRTILQPCMTENISFQNKHRINPTYIFRCACLPWMMFNTINIYIINSWILWVNKCILLLE
jgi:hypothetical protein